MLLALLTPRNLLLAAIAAAAFAAGVKVGGWRTDRLRAQIAETAANAANAANAAVETNAAAVATLDARTAQETATQAATAQEIVRYVYRDRAPVRADCAGALDPVRDAVDGVRKLRAAAGSGGVAPALDDLRR